jgi:predicted MFS family arabinose efflux permease
LLGKVIPRDGGSSTDPARKVSIIATLKQLIRKRPAAGMLGFAFWLSMGNDNLFVVFGAWLEQDFNVSLIALGFSSSVIGAAELMGESMTALCADRIGLKRSLVIGLILTALSYAVLPLIGTCLAAALSGLFFLFLSFEFTIVCSFSLSTELLPTARATMMAGVLAAAGLGRMVGAMTGGPLWLLTGLWGVALASVTATLMALLCLVWGLRNAKRIKPPERPRR